jgi:hypothetical protein
MAASFNDKDIVCPFYRKEERSTICCEGINRFTYIRLFFINKEFQLLHEKRYCMDLSNYTKCPLYTIIAKQYEGKEV